MCKKQSDEEYTPEQRAHDDQVADELFSKLTPVEQLQSIRFLNWLAHKEKHGNFSRHSSDLEFFWLPIIKTGIYVFGFVLLVVFFYSLFK